MAKWHINKLEKMLIANGWIIEKKEDIDDERIISFWHLLKNTQNTKLQFEGFDENGSFSNINKSFSCNIVGDDNVALYIPKIKPRDSRPNSLKTWNEELFEFLSNMSN